MMVVAQVLDLQLLDGRSKFPKVVDVSLLDLH